MADNRITPETATTRTIGPYLFRFDLERGGASITVFEGESEIWCSGVFPETEESLKQGITDALNYVDSLLVSYRQAVKGVLEGIPRD